MRKKRSRKRKRIRTGELYIQNISPKRTSMRGAEKAYNPEEQNLAKLVFAKRHSEAWAKT